MLLWIKRFLTRKEIDLMIDLIESTPIPSGDFMELAEQYWLAYRNLPIPADRFAIYWPHYLLMGHAVEMALKAFLLSRTVSLAHLRSKNHCLDRLRKMATNKGLTLDAATIRSIDRHLGPMHSNLLARYPNYRGGMSKGVVLASESEEAVEALMVAVRSSTPLFRKS